MLDMRTYVYIFFSMVLVFSCKDQVRKFDGFTQKELEYLLASDEGKIWERISREEGGVEVIPDDCGLENYLIFVQGSLGQPKPLLYAYNPLVCDSLDFCMQYPEFCQSDVDLCEVDSSFCDSLGEGVLYIGSWYAKAPFIKNDRSDTLIFKINKKEESVFVTDITSNYATFQYKNRTGSNGNTITENYNHFLPEVE